MERLPYGTHVRWGDGELSYGTVHDPEDPVFGAPSPDLRPTYPAVWVLFNEKLQTANMAFWEGKINVGGTHGLYPALGSWFRKTNLRVVDK